MKKRILSLIALAALLLSALPLLLACSGDHEHHFASEWSKDDKFHWRACTDKSCDAKAAQLPHTWNGGKVTVEATAERDGQKAFTCQVCGYTKTESYSLSMTKTKVTEAEWRSALDIGTFGSVTMGYTITKTNAAGETTTVSMREERSPHWIKLSMLSGLSWYELSLTENKGTESSSYLNTLLAYRDRFADFTFQDLDDEYHFETGATSGTAKISISFAEGRVYTATIKNLTSEGTEIVSLTFSHYNITEVVSMLQVTATEWVGALSLSAFSNANLETLTMSPSAHSNITRTVFKCLGGTFYSLTDGTSSNVSRPTEIIAGLSGMADRFQFDGALGCYVGEELRVSIGNGETQLVPRLRIHFRYGKLYRIELLDETGMPTEQITASNYRDSATVDPATCQHQWISTDSHYLCCICRLNLSAFTLPEAATKKTYTGTVGGNTRVLVVYSDYAVATLDGTPVPIRLYGDVVELLSDRTFLQLNRTGNTFSTDVAPQGSVSYTCSEPRNENTLTVRFYSNGLVTETLARGEEILSAACGSWSTVGDLLLAEVGGDAFFFTKSGSNATMITYAG